VSPVPSEQAWMVTLFGAN